MSSTNDITYKDGRKTLVPLENNPEVLADLARHLGLTLPPWLTFHDVISVDIPELLSARPVHALLCTVPAPTYYRVRANDPKLAYEGAGPDEPVTWFRQTVGNVCGLISFLHAVSNTTAKEFIPEGSDLQRLFADAEKLAPTPRAQLLYDSELLEKAHRAVAARGDSENPGSEDPTSNHFITFVKGWDGHLWELEGSWGGPIDLGELGEGEDMFSERALGAGIRRFLKAAEGDSNFSIVALAGGPESLP